MNEEEQLSMLFKGLGNTHSDSFLATVTEIGGETIDVRAGDGTEYPDVQLKAAINAKGGMILKPSSGSTVLVSSIEGSSRLYVAMFSELDEVIFNRGENGMVKIDVLTDKLNELVKAFNAHVHSGVITAVSGGSGAPAVGVSGNSAKPTSQAGDFNQADYEDTKIKH